MSDSVSHGVPTLYEDVVPALAGEPDEVTTGDCITVTIRWNATWYRPAGLHTSHVERGHCAQVDVPGHSAVNVEEPSVGVQWQFAWHGLPVRIEGIAPEDMRLAVAMLVDTARAWGTWCRLEEQRATRTVERLRALTAELAQVVREVPAGSARSDAMATVNRQIDDVVVTALGDGLHSVDTIVALSGIDAARLASLQVRVPGPMVPDYLLSAAGFARRLGVGVDVLRDGIAAGLVPEPDVALDGDHGWRLETAEAYAGKRLRQVVGVAA